MSKAVNPVFPMWGDGRVNERATLRELPQTARWPEKRRTVVQVAKGYWRAVEWGLAISGFAAWAVIIFG